MIFLASYSKEILFGAVWLALLAWFVFLCPRPVAFQFVIDEWAKDNGFRIETQDANRALDRLRYGVSSVQECANVSIIDRQGRSQKFFLIYGHIGFGTFKPILDVVTCPRRPATRLEEPAIPSSSVAG